MTNNHDNNSSSRVDNSPSDSIQYYNNRNNPTLIVPIVKFSLTMGVAFLASTYLAYFIWEWTILGDTAVEFISGFLDDIMVKDTVMSGSTE